MANQPQYYISIRSYSHPRVDIILSGKTIKQYASMVKSVPDLKRDAAEYCRKQGWEFSLMLNGEWLMPSFEIETTNGQVITIDAEDREDAHDMAASKGLRVLTMYELPDVNQERDNETN